MKTKKFSKKLTLNKKTVADLNSKEMKDAHGGFADPNTRWIGPNSGCGCGSGTAPGFCC